MTSIILMQKLLTMNLDKAEFHKIKRQQTDVAQKKHKAVKSLKRIVEEQAMSKTCRLCLKLADSRIFGGDQSFDVALAIKSILGVEIKEDDGKPQHICRSCERTVQQAMQLKQTAEATQWRLQQELDMVSECASNWSEGEEPQAGFFGALDAAKELVCSKCLVTFGTQTELTEHEGLSCRAERCYVCETCGLALKTMSRLKRHRLSHSGARPHVCPRRGCGYRARTRSALTAHARAHDRARPHACALCAASFASSSNLASHRRTHQPPRFHCQLCGKGFKFKVPLQNHMASQHSDAKPHGCGVCGKAFATRKMILRHELKAHNRPKMRAGVLPAYLRQDATDTT